MGTGGGYRDMRGLWRQEGVMVLETHLEKV